MTNRLEIYKCNTCGIIVEVLHEGEGEMVCCQKPMECLSANTVDAAQEKHVPVIEKNDEGVMIKVGSNPHPMTDEHYIEWIEAIIDGKAYRQFLRPGDKPEAFFPIKGNSITAREYCNLHGLWKNS
ncbi:MAG: desulfoferrodoxin [Chlamydiota bacterium]